MRTLAFGLIAAAAVALSAGSASAQFVVNPGVGRGVVVTPGYGTSLYTPGFVQPGLGYGRSLYTPGFGSPVYGSGYRHPSYGFGHFDYVPGHFDRHGNHSHYHPGHYDYHAPGTRTPRH
jgi:hypothetical protein